MQSFRILHGNIWLPMNMKGGFIQQQQSENRIVRYCVILLKWLLNVFSAYA